MNRKDIFYYKKRKSISHRNIKDTILIVCEGEQTEPNYFRAFSKNHRLKIDVEIEGTGYNTDSLVKKAIKFKEEKEQIKKPYIEIWCVFDRDDFEKVNFNNAFELAKQNGIKIAYSIECFELWYLLHFEYMKSAISRQQYIEKLNELMPEKYKKNNLRTYFLLKDKQNIAIKNAKKLLDEYHSERLYDRNPSTTVFQLVERLNEYIEL